MMQAWTLPQLSLLPNTQEMSAVFSFPHPEILTDTEAKLKYIDDLSLAESVILDTNLCLSLDQRLIIPFNFSWKF